MDLLETDLNTEKRHPWELTRIKIALKLIDEYADLQSQHALDVGSGDAYVAHSISRARSLSSMSCVDLLYTDQQKRMIDEAYANDGLHLYNQLSELPDHLEAVDVITLMDVIEHVPDDVQMLSEVVNDPRIKAHSTFIITVPAHQRLFGNHDILLKHYRRYNLKSLERTTKACGLQTLSKGYFFLSLTKVRLLQLMKEKLLKTTVDDIPHLGTWQGGAFKTGLLNTILMTDYQICRALGRMGLHLPGLSCFIVCRKAPSPGDL